MDLMHIMMHIHRKQTTPKSHNKLSTNELGEWQPRQDSNLEILNQNQVCCQLHHGAVALRPWGLLMGFPPNINQ